MRVVRLGLALAASLRQIRAILRHRQFHGVALVALIAVLIGAFGIYFFEFDANPKRVGRSTSARVLWSVWLSGP
jgi:hypothetical protein